MFSLGLTVKNFGKFSLYRLMIIESLLAFCWLHDLGLIISNGVQGLEVEVVPLFSDQPHSLDGLLTLVLTAVLLSPMASRSCLCTAMATPRYLVLAHTLN